ncbi:MAG: 4-azaleucine resistance transporter AzlC, partial [Marinobacter psychrophilus]
YSLLTSRQRTQSREQELHTDFRITALNQLYWVVGCAAGGFLGHSVAFNSTGIEFALIALFIVLTIEQFKALGETFPLWLGALAAAVAIAVLPAPNQLIGAIMIVSLVLLLQYRRHRDALARNRSGDTTHG